MRGRHSFYPHCALSAIQSRVRLKTEGKDLGNFIIDQVPCGLRAVFPLHPDHSFLRSSSG